MFCAILCGPQVAECCHQGELGGERGEEWEGACDLMCLCLYCTNLCPHTHTCIALCPLQMLNGLYAYDKSALACAASGLDAISPIPAPLAQFQSRSKGDRTGTKTEAKAGTGTGTGQCSASVQAALAAMGVSGGITGTNSSTIRTTTTTTVIGHRSPSVFVGISEMWELSILLLHTFLYQFGGSK